MTKHQKRRLVKIAALVLAVVWALSWALLWLWQDYAINIEIRWIGIVPGLIFIASALAGVRWELVGGVILITEALIIGITYIIGMVGFGMVGFEEITTIALYFSTLILPPLLAGILFILVWQWKEEPPVGVGSKL